MKKKTIVSVFVLILLASSSWWFFFRNTKSKRAFYPRHLLWSDLNQDGKKDFVVVPLNGHGLPTRGIADSGRLLWKSQMRDVANGSTEVGRIFETKELFFLLHQKATAKHPQFLVSAYSKNNGKLHWSYVVPKGENSNLYVTLTLHKDRLFLFTRIRYKKGVKHRDFIRAIDTKTGSLLWTVTTAYEFPRSPLFTKRFLYLHFVGAFLRIALHSGKAETFKAGGIGQVIEKDFFFFRRFGKQGYALFKLRDGQTKPILVRANGHLIQPTNRFYFYANAVGIHRKWILCFSREKGLRIKDQLKLIPTDGEKPISIALPKGYGLYSKTVLRPILSNGNTRFLPLVVQRFVPKKQWSKYKKDPYLSQVIKKYKWRRKTGNDLYLTKILTLDLQRKKIVWESRPVLMSFSHVSVFAKKGLFYLTLPYFNKKGKLVKALLIMDGTNGTFQPRAYSLQWTWDGKRWFETDPKVAPWLVDDSFMVGFHSVFFWRYDIKRQKMSFQNKKNMRIRDVFKQVEATWGHFPKQ